MLSTICSAKQQSLQMCAELRHRQRWVTNRERQRVRLYGSGYNYDLTSIRRPFDYLSEVTKVTVTAAGPLAAVSVT